MATVGERSLGDAQAVVEGVLDRGELEGQARGRVGVGRRGCGGDAEDPQQTQQRCASGETRRATRHGTPPSFGHYSGAISAARRPGGAPGAARGRAIAEREHGWRRRRFPLPRVAAARQSDPGSGQRGCAASGGSLDQPRQVDSHPKSQTSNEKPTHPAHYADLTNSGRRGLRRRPGALVVGA
jgi:hypothetical protein